MSVIRCSHLTLLFLAVCVSGTLPAQPLRAASGDPTQYVAPPSPPSKTRYPQIVRLSLVEGDVRVLRGKQNEHDGGAAWEQAAVNLPLETGFSLVTGKGRAEIEFEDASTMYLGEDSVLIFNDLTTREGVPHTEMALLTGVATVHWLPTVPGEEYFLKTPTGSLRLPFGSEAYMRINSYLDAMTVTPQASSPIQYGRSQPQPGVIGRTFTVDNGLFVPTPKDATKNFSEWDLWVLKRLVMRARAMRAVMQESGLNAPLPGLADMEARGKFFPCAPYGTCWEPNDGWGQQQKVPVSSGAAQTDGSGQDQAKEQAQQAKLAQQAQRDEEDAEQAAGGQAAGGQAAPALWTEDEDDFPCSPYDVEDLMTQDPVTGEDVVLASGVVWAGYDYDWAVCHAGSWLYRQHRYVWVAGRRRHHRHPVRWVKTHGKLGYVPIHPRDVAGKEPINLKHGVFVPTGKKGGSVERIAYDPNKPAEMLAETPKEFRRPALPMLHAAEAPTVEAHLLADPLHDSRTPLATRPVSTIAFDHKSQSFTLLTRVTEGGKTSSFVDHFSGSGQAGGPMLRGGYGGGVSGGSRGGYGGSGGSSRGGGYSGGGGGGSYAGGGSHASSGGSGGSAPSSSASSGGGGGGGRSR